MIMGAGPGIPRAYNDRLLLRLMREHDANNAGMESKAIFGWWTLGWDAWLDSMQRLKRNRHITVSADGIVKRRHK